MFIKITPLDTLFFRDGKPFSMGEDTWATSFILPNPSVIWGTLFSVLWVENPKIPRNLLTVKGIYLLRNASEQKTQEILIPAPLDLFYKEEEKKEKGKSYPEKQEKVKGLISSYPALTSLNFPKDEKEKKIKQAANCFIDWDSFLEDYPYRNGQVRIYQPTYFNKKLNKIGLARRNSTRTSEEGKLYRIEMNEYDKDWCFLVEVEDIAFPQSGILKMGGDAKAASYEVLDEQPLKPISLPDKVAQDFKLYFQTPAFFLSGNGIEELSSLKNAELHSASIGKPVSIGGFDLEKREPKPMRKFVPAGSIYFLKGNPSKTAEEVKTLLSTFQAAPNSVTYSQQGFGQFHISPILNNSIL